MTSTSVTTIDLLRHGEVENDSVFCGSSDDVLTDHGWQQMVKALENKHEWDLIVSSPLQRCSEFAELISSEDDIDLELDKNLQEIDFGTWEGLSPDEIMKDDADALNAWWQSPTKTSPSDGEDFHAFQARVLIAFKKLLVENQGQKILLITDAGVIRVIIMNALGMFDENLFRLNVDFACFSRLHVYHDAAGDKACLIKHG